MRSNRTFVRLAFALGLLAVSLTGCNGLTPQQRQLFDSARSAYSQNQYREAIDSLSAFLQQVDKPPYAVEARYLRGQSYVQVGQRQRGYEDLQAAIQIAQNPKQAWQAHTVLGTLYFEDADWRAAAAQYEAGLPNMPNAPPTDRVLYRLGQCYERTGRWDLARQKFAELVRNFPTSALVEPAKRKLARNAQHFAIQCAVFHGQQNADNFALQLQRKNMDAYTYKELRSPTPVYVVLVGHYSTYEQAELQLGALRAEIPDAVLWP